MMKIDVLDAIKQIVRCNNVNLTIYKENEGLLDFEWGLRRGRNSNEENQKILEWVLENLSEDTVYYGTDFFAIEYCVAKIPETEREYGDLIIIGPYLNELMDEARLQEMMNAESIPMEYRAEMGEYFRAIPIVKNCDQWRELCKSFIGMLHENRTMHVEYLDHVPVEREYWRNMEDDSFSQEIIEERYVCEREFLRAISDGKLEEAMRVFTEMGRFRIAKRYESKVRELRNGSIIMNTLLRKAAERGGVHPVHIDRLSTQMAKKIETISTQNEYDYLINEMIRKYCLLVQNYSMQGYSPVIQKVANYININLTEDLTLNVLAKKYAVSASYLSSLFKKEMGVTITDYANQQRIRRAIALLNSTNMQIQDIASECGIYDASYFRKLFKRYVGKTPSEYLKQIKNG